MAVAPHPRSVHRAAPLLVTAAVFTLAGGFVHLREWLDTYRDVPASAPGAFVVRVGFPVHAVVSVLLAAALVWCALRGGRRARVVVAATAGFQAAALATLILTRTSSVLGWAEPVWTRGADQSRAVEVGALVALAAVGALAAVRPPVEARHVAVVAS